MSLSPATTSSKPAQSAFKLLNQYEIESLGVRLEQYEHNKTGAQHYHLASDYAENVFLVALRTVPEDSTGVAHILEHTALCGSERYPVRDPFFMMIRRSLNTFMNAFTSSDWTAYPFASQNRKDFDNLLQVYLDAVFFSRLDPLDFAQEGHRVEFEKAEDPSSPLVYKGVVYNEMKGAMSSVSSTIWQTLCSHLFTNTTYHYNSGGEPADIPNLSYDELVHFYKSHYHPSNAIFMTFGDIPAEEHQTKFEELALSRFEKRPEEIAVGKEQRREAPAQVEGSYPIPADESTENKTHIVIAWLLGESTNLEDLLEARLLANVLLENSASPLQKLLETTDLGNAPSPVCGMEDSMRELCFVCGIEGSEAKHRDAFEQQVFDVLNNVANEGVPQEQLAAVLHQLELHQREIGGDGYPFGLQLILTGLSAATHRGNPVELLDLDPVIESLRERIQNPDYIKSLAKKWLIDNPHRITLTMKPDTTLSAKKDQQEKDKLAQLKTSLSDEQRQTKALEARQALEEDESILPKVGLEDVPTSLPKVEPTITKVGSIQSSRYTQGTNGIAYQQYLTPLSALSEQQFALLPVYHSLVSEVGIGEADYLTVQQRQSAVCGSIGAYMTYRGMPDDLNQLPCYSVFSSKALNRNIAASNELMQQTLFGARFDEHSRIKELLNQQLAYRESSITNNGHGFAMSAACAGISRGAAISHNLTGLEAIRTLKARCKSFDQENGLADIESQLDALRETLCQQQGQLLQIGDADSDWQSADAYWQDHPGQELNANPSEFTSSQINQVWVTNTQVNFCARAFPTVPMNHPDAAALAVLGGYLRNGFLHRAIREQGGAYGGGASHDSSSGCFRFYSYRDPRLSETLNDFDASIDWLRNSKHKAESLEQAILGVISGLDKPSSPAGEAKQDFHSRLFGRDYDTRMVFRERILATTIDKLQEVAVTYLTPEQSNTAILTSETGFENNRSWIEETGLERKTLNL